MTARGLRRRRRRSVRANRNRSPCARSFRSAITKTPGVHRLAASTGQLPKVWAWEAQGADAGSRPLALLLSPEITVIHVRPIAAARTPGIRRRRLRRYWVDYAHQSRICENQRED